MKKNLILGLILMTSLILMSSSVLAQEEWQEQWSEGKPFQQLWAAVTDLYNQIPTKFNQIFEF